MKDWKAIISGLEYLLQFKKQPMAYVEKMCDAVVQQRGIPFSPQETLAALSEAKKSSIDLATLLPQPHTDATLREFFDALERRLLETMSLKKQ